MGTKTFLLAMPSVQYELFIRSSSASEIWNLSRISAHCDLLRPFIFGILSSLTWANKKQTAHVHIVIVIIHLAEMAMAVYGRQQRQSLKRLKRMYQWNTYDHRHVNFSYTFPSNDDHIKSMQKKQQNPRIICPFIRKVSCLWRHSRLFLLFRSVFLISYVLPVLRNVY